MNNPMYDPGVLAGLAMMRGIKPHDAYSQAAETSYNMQQAMAKKQEHERKQFLAQQLPRILRELQGKSPEEAAALLTQVGIPLEAAALVLERLGHGGGKTDKPQTFTGSDKMQYEAFKDESGRLISRPIPGQQPPKKELTNNEQKQIVELDAAGTAAMDILKLVAESKHAAKQFADNTDRNTAPNTLASKFTDQGEDHGILSTIGNHALYSKKARAARQVVAKVNKELVLDIIKSLKGTGTRPSVFLEQIMNGTTPVDSLDDAAKEVLYRDLLRSASTVVAATKFKQEYADTNGTLVGANKAFSNFRKTYGVKDEDNGEYYLIEPKTGKYDATTDDKISEYIAGTADGEDFFPESQASYIEPPQSEDDEDYDEIAKVLRKRGKIQ